MEKPFNKEVEALSETYNWALQINVDEISKIIDKSWNLPSLAVGSGGSFSVAEYQASLHRTFFSSICQAVTPVEMMVALPKNKEATVWFISASGNHVDVYNSLRHAVLREPRYINVLVANRNTKLHKLSAQYSSINLWEFHLPCGNDGFLATNSLLAFSVIFYRAYCATVEKKANLPKSLSALLKTVLAQSGSLSRIRELIKPHWKCSAIHVLYSHRLKPAALDIESKFIEAGLMSAHLSDIRNFAHGRHHWFAKHADSSGIIMLSGLHDKELATQTLDLLPIGIPKLHLSFRPLEGLDTIAGLVLSLYFTLWLGTERGIDPGCPGVPDFGWKIYRLAANPGFVSSVGNQDAAVDRKKKWLTPGKDPKASKDWNDAYEEFTEKLQCSDIGGIVLDYDGTCAVNMERLGSSKDDIVRELIRLLEGRALIGIVSAEGQSPSGVLRTVIPEQYWKNIIVGYYNGLIIKTPDDNSNAQDASRSYIMLSQIYNKLKGNIYLSMLADFSLGKLQLSITRKAGLSESALWNLVQEELCKDNNHNVEVLRSGRSIDILPRGISKQSLVKRLREQIPADKKILKIGGLGECPGINTFLPDMHLSLSVDEVSFSRDHCWNLCPAGVSGAQGILYYLVRLKKKRNGSFRFRF